MANALPLGHRKLVYPPPYPGGSLEDSLDTSIRRSRPAAEETYMYMVDENLNDQGILWILFDIVMNNCSQSMIFGNVSQQLEKGKQFQKICLTKCCMLDR